MRKFWVVLLSMGLIMALAAPAFAVDVKFSGSYTFQGIYENNRQLYDLNGSVQAGDLVDAENVVITPANTNIQSPGPSIHNAWQRLRVQTVFQVAEGLSLTTRFDAMEKIWGAARTPYAVSGSAASPNDTTESENIKFEHVYVTFNVPFGTFTVGYQPQTAFGTAFLDSSGTTYGPRIKYGIVAGPMTFLALWDKNEGLKAYTSAGTSYIKSWSYNYNTETATVTVAPPADVDSDSEKFSLAGIYKFTGGEAGLLLQYAWSSNSSNSVSMTNPYAFYVGNNPYKSRLYLIDPYVKAKFGPVFVEAEFMYIFGKEMEFEAGGEDVDRSGFSFYLMANVDLAPAYVGFLGAWISGTDLDELDKASPKQTAGVPGGTDWNPCLILYNHDLYRWNGFLGLLTGSSWGTSSVPGYSPGARMAQIYAGVKPIPKLDVRASFTYAAADEVPEGVDRDLGYEADVTVSYKIYDNLEYMVGFGYLWSGDFFKLGDTSGEIKVENDYLVTHKLTLTF
jgi:hypothetical protein